MPDTKLAPWTRTQERLVSPIIRVMTLLNVWAYRLTGGRMGGTFLQGAPVCLVTVKGKRSGTLRTVALLYLAAGDDVVLVASKGGMSHHPAWYHNMIANPDVEVQIGSTTRRMRARRASSAEKAALWPRLIAMYRDYDDYQARTTREIPVMILSPR
ncbi:MAG: nitroreductase family deazaflavin-dependent oxidoreductase [Deltaproteobacteria bacterium]|nr:MAG: nitroreductase family deazaflavin-dependent oxidoreductase [Deltaproteobacteria bacterium]TMB48015.1 MAG: nitroreductase family deazaflavin-dependent oxidoreductase [Deltaproteobacteria bacterium]